MGYKIEFLYPCNNNRTRIQVKLNRTTKQQDHVSNTNLSKTFNCNNNYIKMHTCTKDLILKLLNNFLTGISNFEFQRFIYNTLYPNFSNIFTQSPFLSLIYNRGVQTCLCPSMIAFRVSCIYFMSFFKALSMTIFLNFDLILCEKEDSFYNLRDWNEEPLKWTIA